MNRFVRMASIAGFVGFASQGCGPLEDGDIATGVETTQSALGSFVPTWTSMTNPALGDGPALALGSNVTAFGWGNPSRQIFVTSKNGAGNWSGSWTQLPNSGGAFITRPSATGFAAVGLSELAGKFAVVAMRDGGQYFLTIRDQSGAVAGQDWIGIPNGLFSSAPAITFVPPNAANGPTKTLVLAGKGGDNRIYVAMNTLRSFGQGLAYENRWTGFMPIFNKTFVGAPALMYAEPDGVPDETLVLAARDSNGMFWVSNFNGTSWSAWVQLPNGQFFDGPALATGISGSANQEGTIFGKGLDNRIWVSTLSNGVAAGFAPIGTETFIGSPQALGMQTATGLVNVAAIKSGGAAFSNQANSN